MAEDRPLHRNPLAWLAGVALLLVLVLAGGAWYALHLLRELPGEVAAQGRKLVHEVGDLARAFQTHTVERRFAAFTTRLEGTNYLQVATLQQTQVFELEDNSALLWGTLELPTVVVRATAPVQYTYFVDLEGTWRFELRQRRVLVLAPILRFNKPAVDVSRMRWQVVRGSLLRDEAAVTEQLRREISGRAAIQAVASLPAVRETARAQVARFVRTWLLQSFPDAQGYEVKVYFADEAPAWQAAVAGPT
ncbi:MAG TPA: hypothetical protein VGV61_15915 [Thermoanaerobaculia bacterium]|jgi:hypothetical protein|nr:hypothetical protein [Thermoanaerobaculia bacterium]